MKNEQTPILNVYVAAIPSGAPLSTLFPPERENEVQALQNEKVKREKHFVWQLLAHAVRDTYHQELTAFSFQKNEHGKWTSNGFEFSLSHSGGIVCVALSTSPVGVDIQEISLPKSEKTALKILSEDEKTEYAALEKKEKAEYFTSKWTERESVFKMLSLSSFVPSLPTLFTQKAATKILVLEGKRYALSVASKHLEHLRLFEN